ncbi:MAG TPA: 3-hydroxyacyl-CoA dehydrogenase family protein [Cyclobacteriaceae bacterium]|jgi:3-hydroxybutyryl-CoA dehydrogenase|nr:3-hydroxyacyl-CoA dehydrogenase family protein [Cyclobacteriaceae bacterium]
MEILVIGNETNLIECQQKFGDKHLYRLAKIHSDAEDFLHKETIVYDFVISRSISEITPYKNFEGVAFIDVSKSSLEQLVNSTNVKATFFGFCGMPTFLNRDFLEVSLYSKKDHKKLEKVCKDLNTKFAVVKDQVGLITARIICMIINEAYFAIEENIASSADIDLAMKLGTNYPFGPFEWCEKIGVKNVYELLNAVYESTKDERYKVCELLENEANNFT